MTTTVFLFSESINSTRSHTSPQCINSYCIIIWFSNFPISCFSYLLSTLFAVMDFMIFVYGLFVCSRRTLLWTCRLDSRFNVFNFLRLSFNKYDRQFLKTRPCRILQISVRSELNVTEVWYSGSSRTITFLSKMFVINLLYLSVRFSTSFAFLFIIDLMMFLSSPISHKTVRFFSFLFRLFSSLLLTITDLHSFQPFFFINFFTIHVSRLYNKIYSWCTFLWSFS